MKQLKAHRIQAEIKDLNDQLRQHQDKCKHLKAEKVHRANTGNYDPMDDRYWTDFNCPICLKRWTEKGSK